ncbi:MAG: hypothetical protein PHS59_00715 [Paludibacter sp.]|nr:hypothetical protein [Paludibacter sp.]
MENIRLFIWTLTFFPLLLAIAVYYIHKKPVSMKQDIQTEELYTEAISTEVLGIEKAGNHSIRSSPIGCTPTADANSFKFTVQILKKTCRS